jgi:SAM-dependent methyltransferase
MTATPDFASASVPHQCHVCDELPLDAVADYAKFSRVTSDSKPWPKGGRLFVCPFCACVQKTVDAEWESEVGRIYDSYSIYHQSEGTEQSVFDQVSGAVSSRSAHLLQRLRSQVELPDTGRLLDVGCGNGAFLRAFSLALPHWSLRGTELNTRYQQEIESIPGVEALHVGGPAEVPGCFDLIALVHVLEHVPEPRKLLAELWDKLEFGGVLVLQVPAFLCNPFDLLIADHITHFSKCTILRPVRAAGYEVVIVTDDWIPKELTVVARKGSRPASSGRSPSESALQPLLSRLQWLSAAVTMATGLAASSRLGLFGTSIAATWLFDELGGRVDFFVDEDANRAGRAYMDRPVYLPNDVPAGSQVFVALPPGFAELVKARLEKHSLKYKLVLPPRFSDQAVPA